MKRFMLAAAAVASIGASAQAQTPVTRFACYVPSTGTVYLIKEPLTKENCTSPNHVPFSWVDAKGADHGALSGLSDDDHPRYMLANGMRNSDGGFAVTGKFGLGTMPATGPGGRLMYSTTAHAFRFGSINAPFADGWDLPNLGPGSVAMGSNVVAKGWGSIVLGSDAVANKDGSFVFAAGNGPFNPIISNTKDEFRVHAEGGVVLSAGTFSTCRLAPGSGSFACSSDSAAKADFEDVEPEDVLRGVADLPITRWRYREEADSVRHIGPTAQDFRAAFAVGSGDKHIGVLDAAGVNLAAVKALAARTTVLTESDVMIRSEIRTLRDDIDRLRSERDEMRRRLAELEAAAMRRASVSSSGR